MVQITYLGAPLIFFQVSSNVSGSTRLSPVTVMKLVSPTQRGNTCMWTWPAIPAPAARPMFIPRLMPSGKYSWRRTRYIFCDSAIISWAASSGSFCSSSRCAKGTTITWPEV
jgi:hypothetical protein